MLGLGLGRTLGEGDGEGLGRMLGAGEGRGAGAGAGAGVGRGAGFELGAGRGRGCCAWASWWAGSSRRASDRRRTSWRMATMV
jgi:hypothetical protein